MASSTGADTPSFFCCVRSRRNDGSARGSAPRADADDDGVVVLEQTDAAAVSPAQGPHSSWFHFLYSRYIPFAVRLRFEPPHTALPSGPELEWFDGVAAFVDISGFTKLSMQLVREHGDKGAEMLNDIISAYFGKLIDVIYAFGGDVIKFAGDAVLVVWRARRAHTNDPKIASLLGTDSAGPRSLALLAVSCILKLLRDLDCYQATETIRLRIHAGVGAGRLAGIFVGGVNGMWEYFVAGAPIDQMASAGEMAQSGQLFLSPEAYALVADSVIVAPGQSSPRRRGNSTVARRTTSGSSLVSLPVCSASVSSSASAHHDSSSRAGGTRAGALPAPMRGDNVHVTGLSERVVLFRDLEPQIRTLAMEDTMDAFVPPVVKRRIEDGDCHSWLPEFRKVYVMFIALPDFDYADPVTVNLLQACVCVVQDTVHRYEGYLARLLADDKGTRFKICFGMPRMSHRDDAVRCVLTGIEVQQTLRLRHIQTAIGIATGVSYCGQAGGAQRCEYTAVGGKVVIAARLMQVAGHGNVLCDRETWVAANHIIAFEQRPSVQLKGVAHPVEVFRPHSYLLKGELPDSGTEDDDGDITDDTADDTDSAFDDPLVLTAATTAKCDDSSDPDTAAAGAPGVPRSSVLPGLRLRLARRSSMGNVSDYEKASRTLGLELPGSHSPLPSSPNRRGTVSARDAAGRLGERSTSPIGHGDARSAAGIGIGDVDSFTAPRRLPVLAPSRSGMHVCDGASASGTAGESPMRGASIIGGGSGVPRQNSISSLVTLNTKRNSSVGLGLLMRLTPLGGDESPLALEALSLHDGTEERSSHLLMVDAMIERQKGGSSAMASRSIGSSGSETGLAARLSARLIGSMGSSIEHRSSGGLGGPDGFDDDPLQMHTVGRTREKEFMRSKLDHVLATGETQAVLIEGAGGIGKTNLLFHSCSTLFDTADDPSTCVWIAYAAGSESECHRPYHVWHSIFDQILAGIGADRSSSVVSVGRANDNARDELVMRLLSEADELSLLAPLLNPILATSFPSNAYVAAMSTQARETKTIEILVQLVRLVVRKQQEQLMRRTHLHHLLQQQRAAESDGPDAADTDNRAVGSLSTTATASVSSTRASAAMTQPALSTASALVIVLEDALSFDRASLRLAYVLAVQVPSLLLLISHRTISVPRLLMDAAHASAGKRASVTVLVQYLSSLRAPDESKATIPGQLQRISTTAASVAARPPALMNRRRSLTSDTHAGGGVDVPSSDELSHMPASARPSSSASGIGGGVPHALRGLVRFRALGNASTIVLRCLNDVDSLLLAADVFEVETIDGGSENGDDVPASLTGHGANGDGDDSAALRRRNAAALREAILRTKGNPLFIEELCSALLDQGVAERERVEVPNKNYVPDDVSAKAARLLGVVDISSGGSSGVSGVDCVGSAGIASGAPRSDEPFIVKHRLVFRGDSIQSFFPASLEALLVTKIDALQTEVQLTLKVCAVIDEDLTFSLLQGVHPTPCMPAARLQAMLDLLVDEGFLVQIGADEMNDVGSTRNGSAALLGARAPMSPSGRMQPNDTMFGGVLKRRVRNFSRSGIKLRIGGSFALTDGDCKYRFRNTHLKVAAYSMLTISQRKAIHEDVVTFYRVRMRHTDNTALREGDVIGARPVAASETARRRGSECPASAGSSKYNYDLLAFHSEAASNWSMVLCFVQRAGLRAVAASDEKLAVSYFSRMLDIISSRDADVRANLLTHYPGERSLMLLRCTCHVSLANAYCALGAEYYPTCSEHIREWMQLLDIALPSPLLALKLRLWKLSVRGKFLLFRQRRRRDSDSDVPPVSGRIKAGEGRAAGAPDDAGAAAADDGTVSQLRRAARRRAIGRFIDRTSRLIGSGAAAADGRGACAIAAEPSVPVAVQMLTTLVRTNLLLMCLPSAGNAALDIVLLAESTDDAGAVTLAYAMCAYVFAELNLGRLASSFHEQSRYRMARSAYIPVNALLRVHHQYALYHLRLGNWVEARTASVQLRSGYGNKHERALYVQTTYLGGVACFFSGDFKSSTACFQQILSLSDDADDLELRLSALYWKCQCLIARYGCNVREVMNIVTTIVRIYGECDEQVSATGVVQVPGPVRSGREGHAVAGAAAAPSDASGSAVHADLLRSSSVRTECNLADVCMQILHLKYTFRRTHNVSMIHTKMITLMSRLPVITASKYLNFPQHAAGSGSGAGGTGDFNREHVPMHLADGSATAVFTPLHPPMFAFMPTYELAALGLDVLDHVLLGMRGNAAGSSTAPDASSSTPSLPRQSQRRPLEHRRRPDRRDGDEQGGDESDGDESGGADEPAVEVPQRVTERQRINIVSELLPVVKRLYKMLKLHAECYATAQPYVLLIKGRLRLLGNLCVYVCSPGIVLDNENVSLGAQLCDYMLSETWRRAAEVSVTIWLDGARVSASKSMPHVELLCRYLIGSHYNAYTAAMRYAGMAPEHAYRAMLRSSRSAPSARFGFASHGSHFYSAARGKTKTHFGECVQLCRRMRVDIRRHAQLARLATWKRKSSVSPTHSRMCSHTRAHSVHTAFIFPNESNKDDQDDALTADAGVKARAVRFM